MSHIYIYIITGKKHVMISDSKLKELTVKATGEWICVTNSNVSYSSKKYKMQVSIDGIIVKDNTPRCKISHTKE